MKLTYTVFREHPSNGYAHIHLRVYKASSMDLSSPHAVIAMQWQGDNENTGWYGFHAETRVDNSREGTEFFSIAAGIMRKLTKADESPDFNRNDPAKVIAAIGAKRVVEDMRDNDRWIAPEDCSPADWHRYMAKVNGQCCVAVCAPNEEEAQSSLMKEFARMIHTGGGFSGATYYTKQLELWIAAGKPTEVDRFAKCPDCRPLDEILKPMREPMPVANVA